MLPFMSDLIVTDVSCRVCFLMMMFYFILTLLQYFNFNPLFNKRPLANNSVIKTISQTQILTNHH